MFARVFPWGLTFIEFFPIWLEYRTFRHDSDRAGKGPQELEKVLSMLLNDVERSFGHSFRFRRATGRLKEFLERIEVPQDIADRHAPQLISILRRDPGAIISVGAAALAAYFSRYCSSAEAKAYLIELFQGPPNPLRNLAMHFMFFTRTWVGNSEIFEALASVYEKEGDVDRAVLSAMQKVDSKRAEPYLRKAILNAKTQLEYGGLASIVSRTNSNELFGVLISRMPEFERPAWASKEQFAAYEKWKKEKDAGKSETKP